MKTSDPSNEGSFFRQASFGGTLSRMVTVYGRGFWTFHKIMLMVGGSFCMVWGLVLFFMPLLFGVDPYVENEVYRDENAIAFLVIFAFQCFVASLFGCVGHAALIRATADVYLQLPASKARSYVGVGFRTFCSNLLAGILISLGVFIGLILFILPGIYLGVAWILAHNVIVIGMFSIVCYYATKNVFSMDYMTHSNHIAQFHFCRKIGRHWRHRALLCSGPEKLVLRLLCQVYHDGPFWDL